MRRAVRHWRSLLVYPALALSVGFVLALTLPGVWP